MDQTESNQPDFPDIPGYRFLKKLGKGGMASVYLVVQESIGRKIALKVMAPHLGEDNLWAKRFIREAQVIAQLSHPNIVPIYDVGAYEGQYYIAMEYLKDGSLANKKHGELSLPQIIKIVTGVATGLDYAGEKGFVHRDIKPDNIMFREDGSPVILDFGIVKQIGDAENKMTLTGTVIGTATYMSPEQVQDKELDERSDIYSLGIMLYELLVGEPPFRDSSLVSTMLMHVSDPPPDLPDIYSGLQPVLSRALKKNPDQRYSRARELIQHITSLDEEIKSIIVSQHTAIMLGANDETMDHDAIPDSNTKAIKSKTSREHTIPDDELTRVLSSAQATIRNFSEEARVKKARRIRSFFTVLSVATIAALGFVAYQQFYLVPQEQALADEKIRLVKEASQRKINSLLTTAQSKSVALRVENFELVDHVIGLYREVLTLSPNNTQAVSGLKALATLYLDSTQTALEAENVEAAERYLSAAQQLSSSNPRIAILREELLESRSNFLDKKLTQDKVKTLLNLATDEINNVDGFSESAYLKLQQVLRINKDDDRALQALRTMFDNTEDRINKDIDNDNLSEAIVGIRYLDRYDEENKALPRLKKDYKMSVAALQHNSKVSSLITRAESLERLAPTRKQNAELKGIWLQVIALDETNEQAIQGVANTNEFFRGLVLDALDTRDIRQAGRDLESIQHGSPDSKWLVELHRRIEDKQQSIQTANRLINESKQLTKNSEYGNPLRLALKKATENLDQAKVLDERNPDLAYAIEQLEDAYVLFITQSIRKNDSALTQQSFSDVEAHIWPSNRLIELQLSQQKTSQKKNKRVISGGF